MLTCTVEAERLIRKTNHIREPALDMVSKFTHKRWPESEHHLDSACGSYEATHSIEFAHQNRRDKLTATREPSQLTQT